MVRLTLGVPTECRSRRTLSKIADAGRIEIIVQRRMISTVWLKAKLWTERTGTRLCRMAGRAGVLDAMDDRGLPMVVTVGKRGLSLRNLEALLGLRLSGRGV